MRSSLAILVVTAALLCACSQNKVSVEVPPAKPVETENQVRTRLGIPLDAKNVMVFAQTSHLDIDWQETFEDYYKLYVEKAFLDARKILDTQPKAFYSVAEMAFLQEHVRQHPEELPALQAAAKRGALKVVGGGMTSPDTLLPELELLMRDFLYGTQFAEDVMGTTPHAAWLPDSFGHSAMVPDILQAAGLTSVAMSRIDGAPDITQQLADAKVQPLAGSTAAALKKVGSADFIWRGSGDTAVIGHFLSQVGLYCSGENIDYDEPIQLPGSHIGEFKGDDPKYTDAKIDGYIVQTKPYSQTPYMFVPVGCDFQAPKPKLLEYIAGYNQRQSAKSGVFAVVATFEDYATLVAFHKDKLPEVKGDLAPVYMGFYGSRAEVKRAIREAARPFFTAEIFAAILGEEGKQIMQKAAPMLSKLTRADHHDFVPGTATDDVVANEQLPLCKEAQAAGDLALKAVAAALATHREPVADSLARVVVLNAAGVARKEVVQVQIPLSAGKLGGISPNIAWSQVLSADGTSQTVSMAVDLAPFAWQVIDLLPSIPECVEAPCGRTLTEDISIQLLDKDGIASTGADVTRVELAGAKPTIFERENGVFVLKSAWWNPAPSQAALALQDYADGGGLWRMGQESATCTLLPLPAPLGFTAVELLPAGAAGKQRALFHSATADLEVSTAGDFVLKTAASKDVTRTFAFLIAPSQTKMLETSQPGGAVLRPAEKLFAPTFWPAVNWARVGDVAILLRQSTGVRLGPQGQLELMAARNVWQEKCDLMGGWGTDKAMHRLEWRIAPAKSAAEAEKAAQAFNRPLRAFVADPSAPTSPVQLSDHSIATIEGDGVISTIKPAERGGGVMIRVLLFSELTVNVKLGPTLSGRDLIAVDAAERDLPGAQAFSAWQDEFSMTAGNQGVIAGFRVK